MKGVIVTKNQGQYIPEVYLEKVLQANGTYVGVAAAINGEIVTVESAEKVSMDTLKSLQDDLKDSSALFYFGKHDGNIPQSIFQPYTILKDTNGKAIIVGFCEGDFAGFAHPKAAVDPEFFLINQYICPKVNQLYGLTKGDFKAIIDNISQPIFQRDIEAQITGRGEIVLLEHGGGILRFAKNDGVGASFKWGRTSNSYGYREVDDTKEEMKSPPVSVFDKFKKHTAVAGDQHSGQSVDVPAPAETPADPAIEQPDVNPSDDGVEKITPPKEWHNWSNKDKKSWYHREAGHLPEDWRKHPSVIPTAAAIKRKQEKMEKKEDKKTVRSFQDIIRLDVKTSVPEVKQKDLAIKHLAHASTEPVKQVEHIPLIPADELKAITTDFLRSPTIIKAIDDNAKVLSTDPKNMQALEKKLASFMEQIGMKSVQELYSWPFSVLEKFCEEFPKASAVLVFSLRHELMKRYPIVDESKSEVVVQETDKTVVTSSSSKKERVKLAI